MTNFAMVPSDNRIKFMEIKKHEVIDHIPAGIYTPYFNPITAEFGIEKYKDTFVQKDDVRYGKFTAYKRMILDAVAKNKANLGALAIGNNGSGKSLMGEDIANHLIKKGYPVLFIAEGFPPSIIHRIVTIMNQAGPVMVFFDEFGKIYSTKTDDSGADEMTGKFLVLFGDSSFKGVFFYVTANDSDSLLKNGLINRPSRFRFKLPINHMEVTSYVDMISKSAHSQEIKNYLLFNALGSDLNQVTHGFSSDVLRTIDTIVTETDTIHDLTEKAILYNIPNLSYTHFEIKATGTGDEFEDLYYTMKSYNKGVVVIDVFDKDKKLVDTLKQKIDFNEIINTQSLLKDTNEKTDKRTNLSILGTKTGINFEFAVSVRNAIRQRHGDMVSCFRSLPTNEMSEGADDDLGGRGLGSRGNRSR